MRALARQGIHGEPGETNAATALEAAGRLLLALGVTPDIHPADRTDCAHCIRELMAAADRLAGAAPWLPKPGLPAME
jgi:hypothetical protein